MQSLCLAAYIKTFVTARFLEWGRSVLLNPRWLFVKMNKMEEGDEIMKVLVLAFHPNMEQSVVNRAFADTLKGAPGITLRDLYQEYPDEAIDVEKNKNFVKNTIGSSSSFRFIGTARRLS